MKEKPKKLIKLLMVIILLVVLIIIFILFKDSNGNKNKFKKDFNDLKIECNINSCTDIEYNNKLDELKKKSGLTEEEILNIINN